VVAASALEGSGLLPGSLARSFVQPFALRPPKFGSVADRIGNGGDERGTRTTPRTIKLIQGTGAALSTTHPLQACTKLNPIHRSPTLTS
jgi:hypothetical protein